MTLHEAIKQVLVEFKTSMTAYEIAEKINLHALYIRQDNSPVTVSQIHARVNQYLDIFKIEDGRISLLGLNNDDLDEEEIKLHLYKFLDRIRSKAQIDSNELIRFILSGIIVLDENEGKIGQWDDFTKSIVGKSQVGAFFDLWNSEVMEDLIVAFYSIYRYPKRNRIIRKVIYWLLDTNSNTGAEVLPEYLAQIIGRLNIYSKYNFLVTDCVRINTYKLAIYEHNPQTKFEWGFHTNWIQESILNINRLIEQTSKTTLLQPIVDPEHIEIFTPIWGLTGAEEDQWTCNFKDIMAGHFQNDASPVKKAVLIIPEGGLFSIGKDLDARQYLTNINCIEHIITLPYISKYTGIRSVALIIFDFQQKTDQVRFTNLHRLQGLDLENNLGQVIDFINNPVETPNVSALISTNEIIENDFTWMPTAYLGADVNVEVKDNHELLLIGQLINGKPIKGKQIPSKQLYVGGEIPYIKTSDLLKDSIYLKIPENITGLDKDQVEKVQLLHKNSIVVSFVGNNLKPTLVPEDTEVLFNHNLTVIEVNSNLVLPEFLAWELQEEYIEQQLQNLRTGTAQPFLTLEAFNQLQVQIPSLDIQKDLLISRNKKRNTLAHQLHEPDTNKYLLHNYLGIIKHTMKQPLATLSADIANVNRYLKAKEAEGIIKTTDFIQPLLPGELESENEQSRINNVIDRLTRAIEEAHWRFEQSQTLLKLETKDLIKEKVSLIEVLQSNLAKHQDIQTDITGEDVYVKVDKKMFSILLDNIVDNARKHGFQDTENPKIQWSISTEENEDSEQEVVITYYNNGKPLPSDFKVEKFIANGVTTNAEAGDGFGGYLIHNILTKHNGRLVVIPKENFISSEYNVCFKFYLPTI